MSKGVSKTLPPEAIAALCMQLKELLGSGIAGDECFSILCEDASDADERALYQSIQEELELGGMMSDALEKKECFPAYLISMVRIGERTGTLEDVLFALSNYFDREAQLRESVRSAVVFPLMMGVLMVALLGVLLAFVLPVFSGAFTAIGLNLSPAASVLMSAGKWMAGAAGVLIGLGALAGVVVWYDRRTGKLGLVRRTKLFRQSAAGRFASAMALTLHSGLALDESLRRAGELSGSPEALCAADKLDEGTSLSEALQSTGLFTGYYLRMLRVGERAGRTEQMMEEVASRMSAAAAARTDEQIARIEPVIVSVLAVAAGLILLSVMLPLMGSVTTFM